jgi:hypothetical protein
MQRASPSPHHLNRYLHPARGRQGFYIIGILIAVAIIFILVGRGYFDKDPVTQKRQADLYIDNSKDSACTANRQVVASEITALSFSTGQRANIHVIRKKLAGKVCPGKGKYQVDAEGKVYCTEHSPPPEGAVVEDLEGV